MKNPIKQKTNDTELSENKRPAKAAPPNKRKGVVSNREKQQRHENVANLVGDAFWLVGLVATVCMVLALASFRLDDPAWSRSIEAGHDIYNLCGLVGAYFSDIGFFLFGLSFWWLAVAAIVFLAKHFRPFQRDNAAPYSLLLAASGLLLLLIASPMLEYFAFAQELAARLPAGAGGIFGSRTAVVLNGILGRLGSIVLLFGLMVLGLSLLIQVSWLDMMEHMGNQLEKLVTRWGRGKEDTLSEKQTTRRMLREAQNITTAPMEELEVSRSNRKNKLEVTPPAPVQTPLFDEAGNVAEPVVHGEYVMPALGLLSLPKGEAVPVDPSKLQQTAERIEAKLAEFGIQVEVVSATAGPVITRYEIEPAQGVKGSQIVNLSKDLARAMSVESVRVVETIAGKTTMGIELPNERRQEVTLREILASDVFANTSSKLTVALGKDISGSPIVGDLAKMPHLLVAGMTGSGKSVGVNGMIMSMLYKATPDEVRFIMIDPKMLELSVYDGIAHLLCPVVTDMREAGQALNWCVAEMEKRYRLLSHVGVRNLAGFNEQVEAAQAAGKPLLNPFSLNPDNPEPLTKLPMIVVVIDELADLMMTERKAVEQQIARLTQKARAAGIHMIIATQRPSVDVITGLIKANIPTRMAFTVQSKIDSRTILDQKGAEDLLKYGDLLFLQPGSAEPTRLQGAFVSDHEVHEVVAHIKRQAPSHYVEGLLTGEAAQETDKVVNPNAQSDELFDQAVAFVLETRKTSISSLQRHLRIGYNRAANLMEALENAGVVSAADVGGARKILACKDDL